jgi:hypothetical protein
MLLEPNRRNSVGLCVVDDQIIPSLSFPAEWLEAAKTYVPSLPPHLSAVAWLLDVGEGRLAVEDRIPVWSLGDPGKVRDLLDAVRGEQ